MQKECILSIIIPVYNVEKYLEQCLDSILSEKMENYEVILVNDGSTDNSVAICERYGNCYENIRVVSQENQGLSVARNTGISHAKGKYILFLDSDDFLASDALKQLQKDLPTKTCDFLFGRAQSFLDGGNEFVECQFDYSILSTVIKPYQVFSELNRRGNFWFAAWLVVIRRDFLLQKELFFKPGIYHEDEQWVPRVFIEAETMELWNHCFYCYRLERKDSIISGNNIKKEFDKLIIIDDFANLLAYIPSEKKGVLLDRMAALEWGLILRYSQYEKEERGEELYNAICNHIKYLQKGKYYIIWLLCKIIGIKRVVKIVAWKEK